MANIALIHYYASLIQKKVKKINDVPSDIRDLVQKYLDGENLVKSLEINNVLDKEEIKNKQYLLGAIHIDPIIKFLPKDFNLDRRVNIKIPISLEEIFTKEILKDKPMPENVQFKWALCEERYADEDDLLNADIVNNVLVIEGINSFRFNSGDRFMRNDIIMTSSNYEPMRLVFYLDIE